MSSLTILFRIFFFYFFFIELLAKSNIGLNVTTRRGFEALWNLNQMSECKLGYSAITYNDYGCWFVFFIFYFKNYI